MRLVDSHAHLDFESFRRDLPAVLDRAWQAGLANIVSIGSGEGAEGAAAAVRLAASDERLFATVGVHPHDADLGVPWTGDARQSVAAPVREDWELARRRLIGRHAMLAYHPKVVAIGEVGLDFHYDHSPREFQRDLFRSFIRLAVFRSLPLVIHAREAEAEVAAILKEEGASRVGGVIHCFGGDRELLAAALQMGFSFGLTGVITFPKANALREVVRGIPLDRLLVETDAPYLAPVPHRGKRNEPAYVVEVVNTLAKLLDRSVDEVAAATADNARRLFGIGRREAALPGRIAYPLKNGLYLNLTNRCTLACSFCLKQSGHDIGEMPLALLGEPGVEKIRSAILAAGPLSNFSEVVFCGIGEPLLRLEEVKAISSWLKQQGARVRVNTDGLASLVHGRDVVPELAGRIDTVSVSLNAADAAGYARLCRPPDPALAFEAVCAFIRRAAGLLPEVIATAVDLPGLDASPIRVLAQSLGAKFRLRPFVGTGAAGRVD